MTGWKGKEPYYAVYLGCAAVLVACLLVLTPGVTDIALLLGALSFVVAAVCVGITHRLGQGLVPAIGGLLLSLGALALVAVFHFTPWDESLRTVLLAPPEEGAPLASEPPPAAPTAPRRVAASPTGSSAAPTTPGPVAEATAGSPEPTAPAESAAPGPAGSDSEDGIAWSDDAPPADAFGEPPALGPGAGTPSEPRGPTGSGSTIDATTTRRESDPGLRPTPAAQSRDLALIDEAATLARTAPTLEDKALWESVRDLRTRVEDATSTQDAAQAHEQLDLVIQQRIALRTAPLYARAFELFQAQDLGGAERECLNLINVARSEDIPALHNSEYPAPLPVEQAELLLARVRQFREMKENPEQRFRVRGILKARGNALATVEDRLTGKRHRVREGDRVEEFRVERVDESVGVVHLSVGSRNYALHN